MATPPTSEYTSIGALCGHLQKPIGEIETVASNLGVTAAMTVNGVRYFNATQVEKILYAIRQLPPSGGSVANRAANLR